jgi:hypothetical protein
MSHWFRFGAITFLALVAGADGHAQTAYAQPVHAQPAHLSTIDPRIFGGIPLNQSDEQKLGLVTINGGCSGTLLNRFWVLTARHCVTVNPGIIADPLLPPERVAVTATFVPGRVALASRLVDISGNTRDIVLIYLGAADLGEVVEQPIFEVRRAGAARQEIIADSRLKESYTVVQFGRGFSTYASGVWGASPQPAIGIGTYRSARFNPSQITDTEYMLVMNATTQVGHGGDSGGPTWYTDNDILYGIAGVQSRCEGDFLPGSPGWPQWQWATAIRNCTYVSTAPYMFQIKRAILESPLCSRGGGGACAMAPIIDLVMSP